MPAAGRSGRPRQRFIGVHPLRQLIPFVLTVASAAGCADRDLERLQSTTRATYDARTGKLTGLTCDADHDGRIDTWTDMDGTRPIRSRVDRDGDGRVDRWEEYDEAGRLTRVGFSQTGGDRPDAWAYGDPAGRILRVERSSTADPTRIDRWEYYDAAAGGGSEGQPPLLRVEEDTNGDGRPDRWAVFDPEGYLKSAEYDENGDGIRDRRLSYEGTRLTAIESEPGAAGVYTKRLPLPD